MTVENTKIEPPDDSRVSPTDSSDSSAHRKWLPEIKVGKFNDNPGMWVVVGCLVVAVIGITVFFVSPMMVGHGSGEMGLKDLFGLICFLTVLVFASLVT